jgi:hypothetical protein
MWFLIMYDFRKAALLIRQRPTDHVLHGADPHVSDALSGHGKLLKVSGRSLWPLTVQCQ